MQHEKRQQHKLYKRRYESAPGCWRSLLWLTLSLSRCLGSTGWPTQSRGRSSCTSPFDYRPTYEDFNINTRTYTQIHTPTVVQRGGEGGWWMEPVLEFLICWSIPKRFYLQWKAFDLLYKIRYILWVVALLGACDVTNNGRHLGRHLGFYQGSESRLTQREIVNFCLTWKNNT